MHKTVSHQVFNKHHIEKNIEAQLKSAVLEFVNKQLSLNPCSICVDSHSQSITVTMNGVFSEAEKKAAMEKDTFMMGLIVKNHAGAFKVVKRVLELMISGITGRIVSNSSLLLDPESDFATIILPFEK